MVTVLQAYALVQENWPSFGLAPAQLRDCEDFELAQDLLADRDYPPFDRVMMDGIAIASASYQDGLRQFKLAGVCAAGAPQGELPAPGMALEVMTGAPLPRSSDLVIPYEHLEIKDAVATITTDAPRSAGDNVHREGSDAREGALLLKHGARMNGPHWGIAASIGATVLTAKKLPRVQIISTGDELVPVEERPLDHQIRRSNAHALEASLRLYGYRDIELAHLADSETQIQEHFETATQNFDLLIYSGGVSKGKFDYLPKVWQSLGVEQVFHGVAQKPGKPLWFGIDRKNKTVVLGLPGNPVSGLVCLHRYVLSARPIFAQLAEAVAANKTLTSFLPVRLVFAEEGVLQAHPLKIKNSGEFSALAESDGFIEVPAGGDKLGPLTPVRFHPWRPF